MRLKYLVFIVTKQVVGLCELSNTRRQRMERNYAAKAKFRLQSLMRLGVDVRLSTPVTSCGGGRYLFRARSGSHGSLGGGGQSLASRAKWIKTRVDRAQRVEVQPGFHQ
jgi:hypothetical protein